VTHLLSYLWMTDARPLSFRVGLFVTFLSATTPANGQPSGLNGRVTDSQQAALPGVTVAAQSSERAPRAVVTTDAAGRYRFDTLPPGTYAVVFQLSGFQTERRVTVVEEQGDPNTMDVQLALARLTERVDVVGVTPLIGSEIDRNRIPATVSVIGSAEIQTRGTPSFAETLNERLGAVTLEGGTTNPFQPTLRFRGFTASPLLGLPQGIAVYQNGVRINEPFGDTVQFDLMPQFAVDQVQLSAGADPTYGLNALGGALALRLKNGFDFSGFKGEFSGGSFDRLWLTTEYGASHGPWALYAGASGFDETGWRDHSPSQIVQAVADVAYRRGRVDAGVTTTYAGTSLNGNGPAPVELLEIDRTAVFTYPDITDNRLGFVQGRFALAASSTWSVDATGYFRNLDRRTLNGDEAEFVTCNEDSLPASAPSDTLCLSAGDDDAEEGGFEEMVDDEEDEDPKETPLVDATNPARFITESDTLGNAAFNRTDTQANSYGATIQATARTFGSRENLLVMGASVDLADVTFGSTSEVGTLTKDRTVAGSGLLAGEFGVAPNDRFNTALDTENRAVGLYFSDTVSLTSRAHVTVAGRFNHARVDIFDQLGTSLNGQHSFSRFNPSVGAVLAASDRVSIFGRYSESNRAPTAAELSCADPTEPCRIPNAFISDPPLKQAAARSLEAGARGGWTAPGGTLDWSATLYRTRINDDILFVASPDLIGTGFFQNAGDTQRVGLDLDARSQIDRVGWFVSYALIDATFESPLVLPGNDLVNDATNDNGGLEVEPGDQLPGLPRQSLKTGVSVAITMAWDIAFDTLVSSERVFLGDEGNDQVPLGGYAVANLRSTYRITEEVELFARIDNLFGASYETFGVLAEVEIELEEVPVADDPRFVGPGAPRSGFAGVRVRF